MIRHFRDNVVNLQLKTLLKHLVLEHTVLQDLIVEDLIEACFELRCLVSDEELKVALLGNFD